MNVVIYTDGSSRGNPGPGGYGCILMYTAPSGQMHKLEMSQGYESTTNNRMELMAVIVALEALKRPCDVVIHSDSQYVINGFEKNWVDGWIKKNWVNSQRKPVKNKDLWQRLIEAKKPHNVTFKWVEGHAGHEFNERADELATTAADDRSSWLVDTGFSG